MGNSSVNSVRAKAAVKAKKASKPRPDFPLFPHATGRWAKKVLGKTHYFGKLSEDPKGEAALRLWLSQRDDLLAGRTPRTKDGELTVGGLCNEFLNSKRHLVDTGEITARTFSDYFSTCERLTTQFGARRPVDDLRPADFDSLRADISKTRGPVALRNEIGRVRVVLKFGLDAGLYDKPIRTGPTFKPPARKVLRKARAEKGQRMLEASELRRVIEAAGVQLRAMILLAANAGLGNSDIANLPLAAIDLERGWVRYPRPKTGIDRRFPLWSETREALHAAIAERPEPKDAAHAGLAFITKYGAGWAKDGEVATGDNGEHVVKSRSANPISAEFRKLLVAQKLYREGLGFYAIRHTFETIAGASRDQVAVDHIMGHARDDMASVYRERIDDDRLQAVVEHVRRWLFPQAVLAD